MAVHGDILEVTYNHPTLGSGVFYPKANEGNKFDPGGFRNNDDASMITGSGSIMYQKNRVVGSFEILVENDAVIRQDAQKAVDLQKSAEEAVWTVTHINGSVWKGTGQPVGDVSIDLNAGTFTLKVVSGQFEKIA
jgi:hypothetical protein